MASPNEIVAPSPAAGDTEIETVFLSGLTDLEQGRPRSAIEKFLAILAVDPGLLRVRLELARAYFIAQRWDQSRNEFFIALSGDLPDQVRSNVLNYIQAIDARRGFDWDLSFGISSVGKQRDYDSDVIFLDFSGLTLPFELERDTSSEFALRVAGAANFRHPVDAFSGNLDAVAFAALSFDITEARSSQYDDYIFVGRFGLRTLAPNTTASFGPVISSRLIAGKVYENRVALEAAFERRNQNGNSVFGFISGSKLHNPTSPALDGHEIDVEIGLRRSIGGCGLIGVSAFFENKSVDDSLENYSRKRLTFFGQLDARGGFTLRPSIYVEKKNFKSPNALFTGNPDELSLGAAIKIQKSDVFFGNGFSPFLQMSYDRTKSGIAAFSYTQTKFELGLERQF